MRLALLRTEGAAIVLSMLASTYLRNSETQNSKKLLTNYALMVRGLMYKQLAQLGAGGSGTIECSDLMSQEIMVREMARAGEFPPYIQCLTGLDLGAYRHTASGAFCKTRTTASRSF